MSPPVFLIPATDDLSLCLAGNEKHFISPSAFAAWSKTHESVRPQAAADGTQPKGYRAPQHPVSHLLHSIPPRNPSHSSRSNILSYTLHLATASRLAAHAAVLSSSRYSSLSAEDAAIDEKAAGLFKLGTSLLRSNRRDGPLPTSVERRVSLAALTEDLLSNPDAASAVVKLSVKDVRSSKEVQSIKALQPLTSPESTTLYPVGVLAASSSTRAGSTGSIAQSLIDMKFGSAADEPAIVPFDDEKRASGSSSSATGGRESETVFGASSSRSQLTAAPHMDYRIVRGQAMRKRAKDIYATSILPSTSSVWCRRHRLASCETCGTPTEAPTPASRPSRRTVPGQGLMSLPGSKKPLSEIIPAFLDFSASLLKDLRERASASDIEGLEFTISVADDPVAINVTASWYSLLHSLLIQACLEGYLVEGWTGTSAIEVLFGCGCGVWEGRGWASRVAQSNVGAVAAKAKSNDGAAAMEVDSDDSDDDSDSDESSDSEEENAAAGREKDRSSLVEAATALFGTRDVAQADFERSMRDRTHEFLNVPDDGSLEFHLIRLNAKYPRSSFESDMVEFIEATNRLLGQPSLAKYEAATPPAGQLPPGEPDPFALTRYFSRTEQLDVEPSSIRVAPHRAWEDSVVGSGSGKRRRID
ncbi:hypothetical protein RQP46_000246 [Phenoliferia psychrophenolica]